MAVKKPGLGRSLDALLGGSKRSALNSPTATLNTNVNAEATPVVNSVDGQLCQLAVNIIQPGKYQPRSYMSKESLSELADSIREQGVVQPIVVRPIDDQNYEIIAGERRWRAAQMAGLTEVPAVVRDVVDQVAIAMALIENIQRESLRPLEEAKALQRLQNEFELSHQQVAQAVGRSRTSVTNTIRLLDLDIGAKTLLEEGRLEMGHARSLLGLSGKLQGDVAAYISDKGFSVRQTENLVRKVKNSEICDSDHGLSIAQIEQLLYELESSAPAKKSNHRIKKTTYTDPNINQVQQNLSAKLGAEVNIQHSSKGKGKLVIHYNNLDEFDGILAHLIPTNIEEKNNA